MFNSIRFNLEGYRRSAFALLIGSMLLLSNACSGDDKKDNGLSGVFLDSPVSGLSYSTASFSGKTDSSGYFRYKSGETVTFSIGSLALGSAVGAQVLTPLSITSGAAAVTDQKVTNKLILLETIDEDGNLNNGIQITTAIADIVSANAGSINFDQTSANFITALSTLMTALNGATTPVFTDTSYRGTRAIRTAAEVQAHFARAMAVRNTVVTTYGSVKGYEANSTAWQYLGIPYAKPPVGNLRWKAPENPVAWTGVRDAIEWGDQSAQNPAYKTYGLGGMSEDSLYLNITAPKNGSNLPVMVWFHGGAFGILTGNTVSYNSAASLPSKGVILISVNHRLGAFGYMAHPELSTESGYSGSGNYGQMDLIKALEWVKANIAAFGGNPDNVTIFGQSGGGGKAISLMASPLAKGLFHKVICQSGIAVASNTVLNHSSLATAEAAGTDLFTRLGSGTEISLADARDLSWQTIVARDVTDHTTAAWLIYKPNIDNHYLTDTMENLIKAGLESDVPFLAGANSADLIAGADLAPGITQQMPWRADNNDAKQFVYYWSYVPAGWAAENVGAYHGLELVYTFNYPASFVTHYMMGLPLVSGTTPLADGDISATPGAGMATYSFQILASTGYFDATALASYQLVPSTESITLTDNVMTVWTNFAKNGDPGVESVITWPEYTSTSDAYVEIGTGGAFTSKTGLSTAFGTSTK